MPTYETLSHFLRDWKGLTAAQKAAFLVAVAQLIHDLKEGAGFRKGLRIKKMQGYDSVWEMTWGADARATFRYGEPVKDGEPHIVWRRIGTHSIFTRP